jgi:hypothetical protein
MDARWTFAQLDSAELDSVQLDSAQPDSARLESAQREPAQREPGLLGPPEALLPFCTLAAAPHPLSNLSDDDYALTHAVFYLTDFGRRPPPPGLGARAAELLDPFLAWHSVQLDLDLLGEMLIAALCLRQPRTPALAFAWETFAHTWEHGGLEGPEYRSERAAALAGEEREAYEVGESYHTTFVGGILCAVALGVTPVPDVVAARRPRRKTSDLREMLREAWAEGAARAHVAGSAPPSAAADGNAPDWRALGGRCRAAARRLGVAEPVFDPARGDQLLEDIVARLLQALELPDEPPPSWLGLAMASYVGRERLAPVLGDALLVATARRYRLVQLAAALAATAPHATLRTPTFARAVDFLLDQELPAGGLGVQLLLVAPDEVDAVERASTSQIALAWYLAAVATALGA